MSKDSLQELVSLCKRRGFIFASSEIYGGLSACWDYGPLGVVLKNKIRDHWWSTLVQRDNVWGLDSSVLMHPKVWEASGHTEEFSDIFIDCKSCKLRFRADTQNQVTTCEKCGSKDLTEPRPFHLMFEAKAGALEQDSTSIYLRPETAQGIYVNFLNCLNTTRTSLPFGIAQVGKAFRNEITRGQFIFRSREFEQMEFQYFVAPEDADRAFAYWLDQQYQFFIDMGLDPKNLRKTSHAKDQLSHYAVKATDLEFQFPFGWKELAGVHHRGDFDLTRHQKWSGKKLSFFDAKTAKSFIPMIIECSIGLDRLLLSLLSQAYTQEELPPEKSAKAEPTKRVYLKLPHRFCPVEVAILPLVKKDSLQSVSQKIKSRLKPDWSVEHDETGSIGKRYRRQDEIGTPVCITVDFDTLEDHKVTLRYRDKMNQDRIALDQIPNRLKEYCK